MEYTLDIYARQPELLMTMMAKNCKDRRLERGYSRRTLSERTGVPAPTIERFEKTGKISSNPSAPLPWSSTTSRKCPRSFPSPNTPPAASWKPSTGTRIESREDDTTGKQDYGIPQQRPCGNPSDDSGRTFVCVRVFA